MKIRKGQPKTSVLEKLTKAIWLSVSCVSILIAADKASDKSADKPSAKQKVQPQIILPKSSFHKLAVHHLPPKYLAHHKS